MIIAKRDMKMNMKMKTRGKLLFIKAVIIERHCSKQLENNFPNWYKHVSLDREILWSISMLKDKDVKY